MKNIEIFKKHFKEGMLDANFEKFQQTYPTLIRCILKAMDEARSQGSQKTAQSHGDAGS